MRSQENQMVGRRTVGPTITVVSVLFLIAGNGGCSKKELNDLVDKAKQLPSVAEEAVVEVLPESGHVSLTTSPPVEIKKASIEVISVGDGRPSVVQVTTYDPAAGVVGGAKLILHGTTSATSVNQLASQSVKCSLFLRTESAGVISRTPEGNPVEVSFRTVNSEEGTISGTIAAATLIGSDDSKVSISGGDLLAVIKGGQ